MSEAASRPFQLLLEVAEHVRQQQSNQTAKYYYYPSIMAVVVECGSVLQSKRGSGAQGCTGRRLCRAGADCAVPPSGFARAC